MRFPPIPEDQWSEAQASVANAIKSGPRGQLRGPFVPLLYSPELAACVQKTGEYIRFRNSLPDDLIEMAVLMTARHYNCANMWESHRALAIKANLSHGIISELSLKKEPDGMSLDEQLIFNFCSELLNTSFVSSKTFDAAEQRFGKRGAIDITGLCGYYSLLSLVFNVSEIPLEATSTQFEGCSP